MYVKNVVFHIYIYICKCIYMVDIYLSPYIYIYIYLYMCMYMFTYIYMSHGPGLAPPPLPPHGYPPPWAGSLPPCGVGRTGGSNEGEGGRGEGIKRFQSFEPRKCYTHGLPPPLCGMWVGGDHGIRHAYMHACHACTYRCMHALHAYAYMHNK